MKIFGGYSSSMYWFFVFVLISLYALPTSSLTIDPCLNLTTCYQCLYNSLDCGWCGSLGKCLSGNLAGPFNLTCPPKFDTGGPIVSTSNAWEFTYSHIVNYTDVPGNMLSPGLVTVFLRPGKSLVVPVKLKIPLIPPIDFFFLLDASYSMKPYISLIRQLMPEINGNLTEIVRKARQAENDSTPATVYFGMGSYIEKPVSPFASYPEAYVLKVHTGLVINSSVVQEALDILLNRLAINYEHPENPLEAALLAAYDNSGNYTQRINWRKGSFHILMVCTDASAHRAGDGVTLGIFKPNNHDGIPDGDPPGSGEDYPDPQILVKKLIENNITPLFGAIAASGVADFYRDFSAEIGYGSWVPIVNDSSSVVDAILSGTKAVLNKTQLSSQEDLLNRLQSIVPPSVYGATPNSFVHFNLTMMQTLDNTTNFGATGTTVVRYSGFEDTVTITSIGQIECIGCSLNYANYQIDQCGVCGGNDSTCLGCDNIVNSGVIYDYCGVCGGKNDSCYDCRGIPALPGNETKEDLCGVCGGDNSTCVGCDGIPNSGLEFSNCRPPVCNGPPCNDLTTTVAVLASIAVVGLVFAIVAVVMLVSAGAAMMVADEDLVAKEANLHENPLYEEAKRKFDNPLYGAGA